MANKLKDPVSAERKFDEVVQSAQAAAALVLVYCFFNHEIHETHERKTEQNRWNFFVCFVCFEVDQLLAAPLTPPSPLGGAGEMQAAVLVWV